MANRPAGTYEVDPISRIEGHLGVKVTTNASGIITDAEAHGNLWRGFENFLLGRQVNDAITFTQRICGVCPVPHGTAATHAADAVLGYSRGHITFKTAVEASGTYGPAGTYGIPTKALLIRNLVLSAEFLMSSITHFYHLAAPSYVQGPAMPPWTPFFSNEYYHAALRNPGGNTAVPDAASGTIQVWDAVIISYVRALRIRRLTFEAGALFAGRMPMTSCLVAGGVTNDGTENLTARCNAFASLIQEVGLFIINEYVPIALVLGCLYPNFDNTTNGPTSPYHVAGTDCGIGAGLGRFLAWGAFPNTDDSLVLPGGIKDTTAQLADFTVTNKAQVYAKFLTGGTNAVPANLTEDITHSRYTVASQDTVAYNGTQSAYPGAVTRTKPSRSKAAAYTWMKAPRWAGKACEVGPLARLAVAGIYPVNGTTALATIPGYKEIYTVNGDGTGGLDTRVIAPTIVNALSNMGLVAAVEGWILNLKGGLSTMDRLRARAIESLVLVQAMVGAVSKAADGTLSFAASGGWVGELKNATGATARALAIPSGTRQGWGAVEAPRGALMHQAKITNGRIVAYQCIVPTTWNGSPKDAGNNHGAMEAAVIGAPFAADGAVFTKQDGTQSAVVQGGVEVLRIAQSFDPCIACAVH